MFVTLFKMQKNFTSTPFLHVAGGYEFDHKRLTWCYTRRIYCVGSEVVAFTFSFSHESSVSSRFHVLLRKPC